jgi:hypothetical protein
MADEKNQSAIHRMDPAMRSKFFFTAFLALIGFVVLWFGLIFLAWIGARVTKRYMNQEPRKHLDLEELQDDWAKKPLVRPEPKNFRDED